MFGILHGPAGVIIGPWAAWEGWITRRNGWSIRESIFHHFWYDVAVISASIIADDPANRRVHRIQLATLRF